MATALPKTFDNSIGETRYVLCVKNVPKTEKNERLKAILEQYGKVDFINGPLQTETKFPYRFATCRDQESMNAIKIGMANDQSGYQVENKKSSNDMNKMKSKVENRIESKTVNNFNMENSFNRGFGRNKIQNYGEHNSRISNDYFKGSESKGSRNSLFESGQANSCISSDFLKNSVAKDSNIALIERLNKNVKNWKCFVCNKEANLCCEKCHEIYCSEECQQINWPNHKYVCFKMPCLISASSVNIPNVHLPKTNDLNHNLTPQVNKPEIQKDESMSYEFKKMEIKKDAMPYHELYTEKEKNKNRDGRNIKVNNEIRSTEVKRDRSVDRISTPEVENFEFRNSGNSKINSECRSEQILNTTLNIKTDAKKNNISQDIEETRFAHNKIIDSKIIKITRDRDDYNKIIVTKVKNNSNDFNSQNYNASLDKYSKENSNDNNEKKIDSFESCDENEIENTKILTEHLPKSGQQVLITFAKSYNRLFIRSIEQSINDEYVNIVKVVNESAAKAENLRTLPSSGDMVLAAYEGIWYRAKVLKAINKQRIYVMYVDFGNVEYKQLNELKEMSSNFRTYKIYTVMVTLKDIPHDIKLEMTPKCKEFLELKVNTFTQFNLMYENINSENIPIVTLRDRQTNISLGEQIMEMISPKMQTKQINDKRCFAKDLQQNKFKETENFVNLTIVGNSFIEVGCVTCILTEDYDRLDDLSEILKECGSLDPNPYVPKKDEVCLVKLGDPERWFRAKCESYREPGRCELSLLEYGNLLEISSKYIRKYPNNLNIPVLTSSCFIKGLESAVVEDKINKKERAALLEIFSRNKQIFSKILLKNGEYFLILHDDQIDQLKEKKIFYDPDF